MRLGGADQGDRLSRLRPVSAHRLVKVLTSFGFEAVGQRGSHLKMRKEDGQVTIVPIHPGETIKVGLLRMILKQAGVSREAYLERLRKVK